jgi:hypothetical protein
MGKSVWDRGILKTQLKYKSHEVAGVFKEVSARFSTQECSACASRSGPKGLSGLVGGAGYVRAAEHGTTEKKMLLRTFWGPGGWKSAKKL